MEVEVDGDLRDYLSPWYDTTVCLKLLYTQYVAISLIFTWKMNEHNDDNDFKDQLVEPPPNKSCPPMLSTSKKTWQVIVNTPAEAMVLYGIYIYIYIWDHIKGVLNIREMGDYMGYGSKSDTAKTGSRLPVSSKHDLCNSGPGFCVCLGTPYFQANPQ